MEWSRCQVKTKELKLVKLDGWTTHFGQPKKAKNSKKPKDNKRAGSEMQQVWIQCTQVTRKESFQPATSLAHGPCRQTAALLLDIVFRLKEIQPKDWVNSMVVSSRGDKIRICLDLGDLNKSVKWNIIQFLRSKKFHPKYLMLNSKCSQSSTLEWVIWKWNLTTSPAY